jgi:hypothetical protein
MKRRPDDSWVTFVEVGEQELDPCTVNFESSPAEPDVNWGGDLEVLSVIHNGLDVYPQMSARERDYLLDRLGDHLIDMADDSGYGDYLHDLRKDYALEQSITARSLAADPEGRFK